MLARTLFVPVLASMCLVAQDPPGTREPAPVVPVEPRSNRNPEFRGKVDPPKVCSVPLVNVRPLSRPYMPNFRPKTQTHAMAIPPPAPPCDDEREGTPISRRKEQKPDDSVKP